ncbi:MAG: hypothetical protein RIM84_12445 [Alphaproteobacteria bacterium]
MPVLLLAWLAGCQTTGPASNPVSRTFGWFDYLGGGDVRRTCGAGASTRWRFVYNAIWSEQVRTYDVVLGPAPAVEVHVFSGGIDLSYGDEGLFPAWFGRTARHALTPGEAAKLRRDLAVDLPEPLPVGSFLRSDDFYLTASRCRDGQFAFAAWDRTHPGFEALPFLAALAPFDHSRRAVNPPRALDLPLFDKAASGNRASRGGPPVFQVQVGVDGVNR